MQEGGTLGPRQRIPDDLLEAAPIDLAHRGDGEAEPLDELPESDAPPALVGTDEDCLLPAHGLVILGGSRARGRRRSSSTRPSISPPGASGSASRSHGRSASS